MKKYIFITLLIIIGLAIGSQIDDELSDEAKALLDNVNYEGESPAYLYLAGIFAHESVQPEVVGKQLLAEYRAAESDSAYNITHYPESQKIPLPSGNAFCQFHEEGCVTALLQGGIDVGLLTNHNSTLIARSNRFFEFEEFRTLTKPLITEVFPPYQYLSQAERITLLQAIRKHRDGDSASAIADLQNQFSKIRPSLTHQDGLIGKLVVLNLLSDILDTLSIISHESDIPIQQIASLSNTEKDFSLTMSREFALSYHGFSDLEGNPEFFREGGKFPGWASRIVYKPNMTINAITPEYHRVIALSQMTPAEFSGAFGKTAFISSSKIRNPVGNILASVASPNYNEYVARLMDFEGKITLFNNIHTGIKQAPNPYYPKKTPTVDKGMMCFSGPLEDTRLLRCLRTSLVKQ